MEEKPEHGFFQGDVTLKGAGIADSLKEAITDGMRLGKDDGSWTEFGVDVTIVTLDVLGIVMNPFGELGKAAAGWLIEHVDFLREGIEVVTGDPDTVKSLKATWENISKELRGAAADYEQELSSVGPWMAKTPSGQVYQQTAKAYIGALRSAADRADGAAELVQNSGIAVAAVRGLIFDLIAELVGKWVGKLIAAGLAAVFTFGASVAAFIVSAIADACILAKKIFSRLRTLVDAIEKLGVFLRRVALSADNAASSFKAVHASVQRGVTSANNFGDAATKRLRWPGQVISHKGAVPVKEGAKQATDEEHPK
ncbi:hypothetical protein JOF53_004995 [Crossiella equi]|uniref:Uncharacterized protein n=1 Tax=Crossiella equi TaxID=130796 RepID=A0ABS5AHS9_9PSEU|nr:hypothetical protein [Crossiella equi]MBP2476123.1 hypothetical protein [Crossiella equi]